MKSFSANSAFKVSLAPGLTIGDFHCSSCLGRYLLLHTLEVIIVYGDKIIKIPVCELVLESRNMDEDAIWPTPAAFPSRLLQRRQTAQLVLSGPRRLPGGFQLLIPRAILPVADLPCDAKTRSGQDLSSRTAMVIESRTHAKSTTCGRSNSRRAD